MIHLGIIEDETSVRENLQIFFNEQDDMDVVQTAGSVEEFSNLSLPDQRWTPFCSTSDFPEFRPEGMRNIKSIAPDVDIIILSAYDDSDTIFKAICAGAISYISKRTELPKIKDAIITVNRGGAYMSPVLPGRFLITWGHSLKGRGCAHPKATTNRPGPGRRAQL